MNKSISAKVLSNLLVLWPKMTAQEAEEKMAETLKAGEKPTPPPNKGLYRLPGSD